MSITSDEVNYLVYRYLLESGFTHSTFAFQYETAIHRSELKVNNVRPGALISLLQKGLLYSEVETHLNTVLMTYKGWD
jgi:transducin (beta)-like 1